MGTADDKVLDTADRLRVLREAKAKRDEADAKRAALLEIEVLEVEERLAAQHGPRGVRWTILETSTGPIGLVLGPSVLYKRLEDAKEGEYNEALYAFVLDQVDHPTRDEAMRMFGERRGLIVSCGEALIALHKGRVETARKKG